MNLQELLDFINFVANKHQLGRTVTPSEYNNLLKIIPLKYFKRCYGLSEEYQFEGPFNKEVWELSQNITDKLKRFKVPYVMAIDANGHGLIPSDYFHVSAIRFYSTDNNICNPTISLGDIEILTDAQWAHRYDHSIMPPTFKDSVCLFQSDRLWFMPKNLQYVEFTYLRRPTTPVYDYYTVDTTLQQVYLEPGQTSPSSGVTPLNHLSTSVELEWSDIEKIDIIEMMLKRIGVKLRDNELYQTQLEIQQSGK